MPKSKLLLFGGTGAIGQGISAYFSENGWDVTVVSRKSTMDSQVISWDPLDKDQGVGIKAVKDRGPFDAVCWAQGANANDNIYSFNKHLHRSLYEANVLYVMESMHTILTVDAVCKPARFCVISSIWQNLARQNKLSYTVSKAALRGLVLSLANDLAPYGHLVNAILPGVIDNSMTRTNLSPDQIDRVTKSTQFERLPSVSDVASATFYVCSRQNTGLTGQFLSVDLGFSHVRIV